MNSNLLLKIIIIILIFFIFFIVLSATTSDLHSWITFEPNNAKITEGKVIDSYYDYGVLSHGRRYKHKYKTKVIIVAYNVNGQTYTTEHRISYGIADDSQVGDTREVKRSITISLTDGYAFILLECSHRPKYAYVFDIKLK